MDIPIKFDQLIEDILKTPLSLMGDWHNDPLWINNQKFILNHLSHHSLGVALEHPREWLARNTQLKNVLHSDYSLPLITSYDLSTKEADDQITFFIKNYLKIFHPLLAIIGKYHLEEQAKRVKSDKIIINQSFNRNSYPHLDNGVYLENFNKNQRDYLIKGDLSALL